MYHSMEDKNHDHNHNHNINVQMISNLIGIKGKIKTPLNKYIYIINGFYN